MISRFALPMGSFLLCVSVPPLAPASTPALGAGARGAGVWLNQKKIGGNPTKMSLPDSEPLLPEPEPQPLPEVTQPPAESPVEVPVQPALRRRRPRRRLVPRELERRMAFFGELIHLATPSFDFFLFSLIAGLMAGAALFLDSPALYLLTALLAPFMAPVLGLALAATIGSLSLFFRSLIGLAIGGVLVFAMGAVAGLAGQYLTGLAFTQVVFHVTFSWADLLVVLLGAAFTAYLAVRAPQQRPLVSSVALAYELFLPLAAAGFGLVQGLAASAPQGGQGLPGLFPGGVILFATHLALAAATAAFVLFFLGVRPLPRGLGWLASLLLVVVLVGGALLGLGNGVLNGPMGPTLALLLPPSATPSATPTFTFTPPPTQTETPKPLPSGTFTPVPPSNTPTNTLVPIATATITVTPSPTPVYGMVNAGEQNGIIIRPEPNSLQIVTTLFNGSLVEILPEVVNKNGFLWLHVRTPDGKEGWVQASLIITATPRPR